MSLEVHVTTCVCVCVCEVGGACDYVCVCVRLEVHVTVCVCVFINKFIYNMLHYRVILHVPVYTSLHGVFSIALW